MVVECLESRPGLLGLVTRATFRGGESSWKKIDGGRDETERREGRPAQLLGCMKTDSDHR